MTRLLPWAALLLGYAFLYAPIAWIVAYSFNASQLVTVWGGASTRWYAALANDRALLDAASLSLGIAVAAASGATVLGGLAGFALARFGRFPGRTLFGGMLAAPLVMPEVLTGLSLLLLFVAAERLTGWPAERGATTVILAHVTFAMAFVAVVVRARLAGMDPALEEAAADLGAHPLTVARTVLIPLAAPGLLAGWLLAFSLSLEDYVITAFVTGPGSTTLPLYVFSTVRLGLNPEVNALGSLIVGIVAIGGAIAAWSGRKRNAHH